MSLGTWLFDKLCKTLNKESKSPRHSYLCDFDRISHEIIPGDVLIVEGNNRISKIIKRISQSPWTHAALYVGRLHSIEDPKMREMIRRHYHGSAGQQLVVETIVGVGTRVNPVSYYKNHHIRICRPSGISHSDSQRVINYCIKRLGRSYDTRHFIDLGRFLLASRWYVPRRWKSVLFDQAYNATSRDICSAMIAEAFTSVKFPLLPYIRKDQKQELEMIHRNPRLFAPCDFDYSPYFAIIKYPIFGVSGYGPYRDLPWNEDLVSHDEGVVSSTGEDKE